MFEQLFCNVFVCKGHGKNDFIWDPNENASVRAEKDEFGKVSFVWNSGGLPRRVLRLQHWTTAACGDWTRRANYLSRNSQCLAMQRAAGQRILLGELWMHRCTYLQCVQAVKTVLAVGILNSGLVPFGMMHCGASLIGAET